MEGKFSERRGMIDNLLAAIRDEKLEVYLQPKVALLHKSAYGLTSPFPGRTYPVGSVIGMPSAV